MKDFRRVFKYVWPQWPRLVAIACSALVIGMLFSLSFGTVLPLLKVMMGEEGLRGWVNRKVSEKRYGISFYVLDRADLSDPNVAYYLRITNVEEDGFGEQAGLRSEDMLVGAGDSFRGEPTEKVGATRLLAELASVEDGGSIEVQYLRYDESGRPTITLKQLQSGKKPFYADTAHRLLRLGGVPDVETKATKKDAVVFIIILMMVVTATRCAARFCQNYVSQKVVSVSLARLREDTFRHSLQIPIGFFADEGPSSTVSRLIRDTDSIGSGIKILLGRALREPLKVLGLVAMAMWIDLNMTLVFLCGAPLSLYAISRFGKQIKRATKKSLLNWAAMLCKLRESLDGVKVIKVYNRQDEEGASFVQLNRRLLKQQFRIAKVNSLTGPLMEVLGMVAGSVGLIFGAQWVYRGEMEASEFFTLLVLLGATAESVRQTSSVWNKVQQANAGAERVFHILDQPLEREKADATEFAPLQRQIEFRDVSFSYPGSEKPVLKDVVLVVEAGHNVAIVGPNGSGKTTLANLIPRLYDPQAGAVLIDGNDIRDATLVSLRKQIAMVTQNVVTFNDTIAANIEYGKSGATREEIMNAARRSFAHEFVEPLPEGYDTIIGEQGVGLSGGQLQRIVIARAILKNPAILIFDEATSQVDADSEAKIHEAIKEIMQDRTSFVIAHRFSTVINADLIVVMDEGRIIAKGQHEELIQTCPLYQGLYATQLVKA